MQEVWQPVKGYEGHYEVSDHGRVRSLDRVVPSRNGHAYNRKGTVLKFSIARSGHNKLYRRLAVSLCLNGSRWQAPVARLVAEAFVPNPENHPVVRHRDGESTNNHASNLIWGTQKENGEDAAKAGVMPKGSDHFNSKLTAEQAGLIKRSPQTQAVAKDLAEKFGVHYTTVRSVWQGKSWQWV